MKVLRKLKICLERRKRRNNPNRYLDKYIEVFERLRDKVIPTKIPFTSYFKVGDKYHAEMTYKPELPPGKNDIESFNYFFVDVHCRYGKNITQIFEYEHPEVYAFIKSVTERLLKQVDESFKK